MEVMYPRCAGLDVHKETVVACVAVKNIKRLSGFLSLCEIKSPFVHPCK